jgi:membrane protein
VRLADKLDAWQQERRWSSFPIGVVYKFVDDQGIFLAALITYYGFLSLFPLLLLVASLLGFLLQNRPELRESILDTAVSQFPVIGAEVSEPAGLQGSSVALWVGVLIALYGASRVSHATQHAMNVCWAVPRHQRPNPIMARLRSSVLIGIAFLALIGSTVLSALGSSAESYGLQLHGLISLLLLAASLAMIGTLFALGMRHSTPRSLGWSDVLPGAVVAAVGWQVMQTFGATYVGVVVNRTNDTYGVFALVLGLMGWLFVVAVIVVMAVEINVVHAKGLYPRSLLSPFTEQSELTAADEQSFSDAAVSTRFKERQGVQVTFDDRKDSDDRTDSDTG